MSRIRFDLVVATLCVATSAAAYGQDRAPSRPSCVFPASKDVADPVVVGPDSIAKRVEFVQPKDAPIRILRADFTGATLTTGGFFRFTHTYSLEVLNVSDQVASVIGPFVWVYSGNADVHATVVTKGHSTEFPLVLVNGACYGSPPGK